MTAQEIVKNLLDAIQKGDFQSAKTYMSDDFIFSGPIPEPINREQWLKTSADLKKAFPDLNYRFATDGTSADVVNITSQLSGTHNGSFDLTFIGMGIIPASGKAFKVTSQPGKVTVKNGKVISFVLQPTEGAGLMAILSQIGIQMPVR